MNLPEWIAVVNPNAGGGMLLKEWPIISNYLKEKGLSFDEVFTTHRYHAVELVIAALRKGFRNIISVGGDGTLHEIVNGIFHQKEVPVREIRLAVIPAGSGNDWGRMNGISSDYRQAAAVILEGKTILQDVAKVVYTQSGVTNLRYMVNGAGIGLDANICHYCNQYKQEGANGPGSYVKAALRALISRTSNQTAVQVDGKEFFRGNMFSIAFGIGKYSGGGMLQVPDAVGDDGKINLMVAAKVSKLKFLLLFRGIFHGKIYDVKEVSHTAGQKFVVAAERPDKLEIDGEVVGTTPASIEVMPNALRVVVK